MLKQVHSDTGISIKATSIMNGFTNRLAHYTLQHTIYHLSPRHPMYRAFVCQETDVVTKYTEPKCIERNHCAVPNLTTIQPRTKLCQSSFISYVFSHDLFHFGLLTLKGKLNEIREIRIETKAFRWFLSFKLHFSNSFLELIELKKYVSRGKLKI